MSAGWLTLAQIADELGVSIRSVQRWVAAGDLPALRLPGGQLRVRSADFAEFVDARMTTAAAGERRFDLVDEEVLRG